MVSTRPYLIRAIYEWAEDHNLTPHLLVDTTVDNVIVPTEFIEDNKIILNVAASAVVNLDLGDEYISFGARFAGVAHEIFVPTTAVRAIYARENGIGLVLPDEPETTGNEPDDPDGPDDPTIPGHARGSHLKVVK
tara:strand:- start:2159 stop:2563 length:405 start_codon:yes stop_codon:yes gene_type:complete